VNVDSFVVFEVSLTELLTNELFKLFVLKKDEGRQRYSYAITANMQVKMQNEIELSFLLRTVYQNRQMETRGFVNFPEAQTQR